MNSAGAAVFGASLFTGAFSTVQFNGFNPDYQISIGDQVRVRMWGSFTFEAPLIVDAQGNIFIPNVGPVNVQGVRNGDLNGQVEQRVKKVYSGNVGVYASLESAQPVKIFVTGFVRQPGLYGGLSSDSILYYVDRAGGIDLDRGGFLEIKVLRRGQERATYNLYQFVLTGKIDAVQLLDGDTIVVGPRRHTVNISGEVTNSYTFEFTTKTVAASDLLALAKPRPGATHMSIVRNSGIETRSEYLPLRDAPQTMIEDGDVVTVTSDKYPGTILVRINGATLGEHTVILPYGATIKDVVARLKPAPQANVEGLQLFRLSVAARQKAMIENSLRSIEAYTLTARSATVEEAQLRTQEAALILQFIDRARTVVPRGQVVLGAGRDVADSLLEDGDIVNLPEKSSLVFVHGEVLFPNAIVYARNMTAEDYIKQSGGFTQNADNSRILVLRQDGTFTDGLTASLIPGDEIMVLPKVDSKNIEVTRGISQIIYQLAVAAKVVFGL